MSAECQGEVLMNKEERQLISCNKCGFIHVIPSYTERELEEFYENYYAESTPSYLWFEKVYNIKKWKDTGRILDIGCWEGKQLEFFIKEGWECVGTELNKNAASVAASKGIEVHQISIREFFEKFADRKWDVINISYILEHIPDPADFLKKIKNNLNKDGMVIIEVPNEFNPLQMAYLKEHQHEPYWVALPDHLNYFNKEGLENLMERAGFNVIHGESSFPLEMFLLMGDNYLEDSLVGKHSFGKVVEMERILRNYNPELLSSIYSSLFKVGIGRSIILYASLKIKE
ncbi:MAG: class I SAM-dependent methyltransferase [Thermodesulfovibrionia bacterium]|nr:class I SAM-dependent methyltransferase [Thermodesulfovibrionia bacterium]